VTVSSPTKAAFTSLLVGSVAGGFAPAALTAGASFTVPPGEAPLAGYWLLFNKPAALDLAGQQAAVLKQGLVDGKELPATGLPEGTIPHQIELQFQPGSNPLDPRSVQVTCNGRALPPAAFAATARDTQLAVTVSVPALLPPGEATLTKYTPLNLDVSFRDQGLMRQRGGGQFRLVLQPKATATGVWLSTVKPVRFMVHGALGLDKDYMGQPIRLAGVEYPRGLSTHPEATPNGNYAEVIFDLKPFQGQRQWFRALVGIPDGEPGSSQFFVYTRKGDGEWVERAKTGVLTTETGPEDLKVSIDNADELRLYVNDGGNGISSDHGMWAQARLE
jgi:hypothetical protein